MENIHVQAPVAVIFICGGRTTSVSEPEPASIRDAFLKILDNPALRGRKYILAEEVNPFYMARPAYSDYLKFEIDLAQITELIVLFCESSGSFAELGAFSMISEISERILVVIRDKHYNSESFIKTGPLLSIQNRYGDTAVCVIDDDDVRIINDSVKGIDKETLKERLKTPITNRIREIRQPTTFDSRRSGHLIKLMVGLIQEYGALTLTEMEQVINHIGINIPSSEIDALLLCAEAVEWIKREKKGVNTYFFAVAEKDAANLSMKENAPVRDKLRRRQTIREYWKTNDTERYRGIVRFMGGAL